MDSLRLVLLLRSRGRCLGGREGGCCDYQWIDNAHMPPGWKKTENWVGRDTRQGSKSAPDYKLRYVSQRRFWSPDE